MINRFNKYLVLFSVLLLPACSTHYASFMGEGEVAEKVADIESEPITRLSFVPADGTYDDMEIVVYEEIENVHEIVPAAGDNSEGQNEPQ